MSNEVSRSNQMINKTTIGDKFKTYLKHPGSFILMLLVMLAALVTFAVLIFLIAYILINGLPHIKPCFRLSTALRMLRSCRPLSIRSL